MSRIVGGGGGGLTEDEVNTLIGRGEANGTAGLDSTQNLMVPNHTIRMRTSSSSGNVFVNTGLETCLNVDRLAANTFQAGVYKNGVKTKLLDASDRNGATSTGVAAIYNPCKTIFNEHRPVCTKEYHLVGKYLDGNDNPDVWFPIKGDGVDASVTYANRVLTLNSGSGMTSASRCVIDQTKFPITGNFLEVTAEIANFELGEGGLRRIVIGFQDAFSATTDTQRAIFMRNSNEAFWRVGYKDASTTIPNTPLGRDLQQGDIITVRLDRTEGSPNIDIVRFYVNGQKIYESTQIPTVNCYAGVGVFNMSSLVDIGCAIGIKYFGVRYVP